MSIQKKNKHFALTKGGVIRYHRVMAAPRFYQIEAKSAMSRGMQAEPFLCCLYRVMAPYRGCGHGCVYCDGRAEKYYVEGIFDRDIGVRFNLPELMARDTGRLAGDDGAGITTGSAGCRTGAKNGMAREFGAVCIGSGVTDVYQPYDGRFALTRKTLEALVPLGLPIVILTKNARIVRDFDLLKQFPRALVILTVTTVDPGIASILEPGASPPAKRLETVRLAREEGFHAGVMAMPLCPGITDSPEAARALFRACREAGAEFVYPGGLTLRPGCQKGLFFETLIRHFPDRLPLYNEAYAENRQSGAPKHAYRTGLEREIGRILDEEKVPSMIPHSVYRNLLSVTDAIFVLLCHMQTLYAAKGVDTRSLKAAAERYGIWISENRKVLRRGNRKHKNGTGSPIPGELCFDGAPHSPDSPRPARPGVETGNQSSCGQARFTPQGQFPITDGLDALLRSQPFAALCGNDRLGAMIDRIIHEGAIFDYPKLGLKKSG